MKQIRMDNYHEYVISDEAYAQIVPIVEANQVCRTCGRAYSEEKPQVAQNTCLVCFLRREKDRYFTYAGVQNDSHGVHFKFVDPKGYVYTSHTSTDRSELSNYYTILHYGFPVPATYQRNGKTYRLERSYWYIYGDFRTNAVIVIDYHEVYGDHLHVGFIVSKDGKITEINRRKGDIQKLYKRARARAEAVKHPLDCSSLYDIIADLLSSEYEQEK